MPQLIDAVSEARLQNVMPWLANQIRTMAAMLATESIAIRVTQGLRTWQEQATLYAQGRTLPGKIVTNAPPGHSYHQFGLAVDVVPMDQEDPPQPDWNIAHPAWQRIVDVGTSLGLTSGACFSTIKDWPHLQFTGPYPESPNDEVRQILVNEGMEAVWQQVMGAGT